MKFPYYRVTRKMSLSGVESWFDWFVSLEVPCAIVKEERPYGAKNFYSVWVIGKEATHGDTKRLAEARANSEVIQGEIVKEKNFSAYVNFNRPSPLLPITDICA